MVEITRIEPRPASFVLATTFLVMQAIWLMILVLLAVFGPTQWATVAVVIFWIPVVTIAIGATTYLFAAIYNLLAARIGGMVVELGDRHGAG